MFHARDYQILRLLGSGPASFRTVKGLTIPLAGTSVTPLGHAQSRSASTTVDGPPMRSKSAEASVRKEVAEVVITAVASVM